MIYVDFEVGEKICGLAASAKADKGSLTQGEKNAIKKLISAIELYYNTKDEGGVNRMSQVYEDIMASLNELMDAAQGKETGIVRHTRTIKEVESFSPEQIKYVRTSAKMTQKTFAACIGVSQKSVEAWEGGRSKPDGAARRLIGLMRDHADFAQMMGIVSAN